jgi:hypothetical protein
VEAVFEIVPFIQSLALSCYASLLKLGVLGSVLDIGMSNGIVFVLLQVIMINDEI